ncbi:MAG: class IV adenylate cyclase [Spirochaetes bacterium]|nr:MAG: class IV adenylate cyclase [Spirochaetota bacterium]
MPVEVELKAWVKDRSSLEKKLKERFDFKKTYIKKDIYYSTPHSGLKERFRLRQEEEGEALVTIKKKKIVKKTEQNIEIEFRVSDPQAFEQFVLDIGCRKVIKKVKRGDLYTAGEINIELTMVEDLGEFIEIEKIVESEDSNLLEQAREEINYILHSLGVSPDQIEERYYVDMLKEKIFRKGRPSAKYPEHP